jgi:SAM-dependent methyltransferase
MANSQHDSARVMVQSSVLSPRPSLRVNAKLRKAPLQHDRKFNSFRQSEVARNVHLDLERIERAGHEDLAVLCRLYYSMEFALGQVLSDGDLQYHPNASFSVLRFIAILRSIKRRCGANTRFLDVGCGLGGKVWIADALGFDSFGLEINRKYAEIAGECVGTDRIVCCNALTFPNYDCYDVIYFYNPMPSAELEFAILESAKKGAIIYHAIDLQAQPNRDFSRLSPRVLRLTDQGRSG